MWKKTDPRFDINKRGDIVILRRSSNGHYIAGTGFVDTKNGWLITTDFEDHRVVDEWDSDWLWTRIPDEKDEKPSELTPDEIDRIPREHIGLKS